MGYLVVEPVHVIQVDDVGVQAGEALVALGLDRFRATVHPALAVHERHDALAGEKELVAPVHDRGPEQPFVVAVAVQGCRVEEVIADVERLVQEPLGVLAVRGRSVSVAKVHAAEANGVDFGISDFSANGHEAGFLCVLESMKRDWARRRFATWRGSSKTPLNCLRLGRSRSLGASPGDGASSPDDAIKLLRNLETLFENATQLST